MKKFKEGDNAYMVQDIAVTHGGVFKVIIKIPVSVATDEWVLLMDGRSFDLNEVMNREEAIEYCDVNEGSAVNKIRAIFQLAYTL